MEFSDIYINEQSCDITGSNEAVLYENMGIQSATEGLIESPKVKETVYEEFYEPIILESKPKNKGTLCNLQEDTLKRLKRVIYILSALIIVLYITAIVQIIIVVVPKDQVTGGGWTDWGNWTTCTVTCGGGIQSRTRRCTNPKPSDREEYCIGDPLEIQPCSLNRCSLIDGGWTGWDNWSTCTVTCGGGIQSRTRTCTNPKPSDCGEYCIGDPLKIQPCSLNRCSLMASAFSVDKPSSCIVLNSTSKLTFSNTIYKYGDDFNSSTGTYTCSIPGIYHFSATFVKKRASPIVDNVYCSFYKSGLELLRISIDPTNDDMDVGNAAISQSVVIHLDKGDTVYIGDCFVPTSLSMEYWSSFTGFLLYPDN